jgi:hypothetical protein
MCTTVPVREEKASMVFPVVLNRTLGFYFIAVIIIIIITEEK